MLTFLLTGCGLTPKGNGNGNDGNGNVPPPVGCEPINLVLAANSDIDNPCSWTGQTAGATADQVNNCMVAAGELTGTRQTPGVGAITVLRSGTQVRFAATANGSNPWTLDLPALDCNTPGTCGDLFDAAEYQVIIENPTNQNCSDFGELTLTIPLHQ